MHSYAKVRAALFFRGGPHSSTAYGESKDYSAACSADFCMSWKRLTARSRSSSARPYSSWELMRMYTRWADKHGHKVDVYDISYAEEAGIKSATFVVHGEYMYGTLSVEQGAHRLVRLTTSDTPYARQTSVAEDDVVPVVEHTDAIEIADAEVRVDVYRTSGPGGQSVNTTDSAVRLTQVPTGIVVTC